MKHAKGLKMEKKAKKIHCKITDAKLANRHSLSLFLCKRQKAELFYFKTETNLVEKVVKKFVGIYFRGQKNEINFAKTNFCRFAKKSIHAKIYLKKITACKDFIGKTNFFNFLARINSTRENPL